MRLKSGRDEDIGLFHLPESGNDCLSPFGNGCLQFSHASTLQEIIEKKQVNFRIHLVLGKYFSFFLLVVVRYPGRKACPETLAHGPE